MKKKWLKIAVVLILTVLTGLLLYKAFITTIPQLWEVLKSGNETDIEHFLQQNDDFAGLMYLALLQFIQVVSIVIPSAPIRIAGGLVYGAWRGFVACHISYVIANLIIFLTVRRFRTSLASTIPTAREKQEKVSAMLDRGDPFMAVILACMIPAVPNGMIPYAAAANEKLSAKTFVLAVYIGSILSTFIMCAIGRRLLSGDYLLSVGLFVINLIIVYILYRNEKRLSSIVMHIRNSWENRK